MGTTTLKGECIPLFVLLCSSNVMIPHRELKKYPLPRGYLPHHTYHTPAKVTHLQRVKIMVGAMQTLKRYNSDVTNYCRCLDFEARRGRIAATEQQRRQTAAVEVLQSIPEKFNQQVRLFKANASR